VAYKDIYNMSDYFYKRKNKKVKSYSKIQNLVDLNPFVTGQAPSSSLSLEEYAQEICTFYQSILASMPNHVYWLDRNCVLRGGNDKLAHFFGLKSASELAGLPYEEMSKLANWTEGQGESFKKAELEVMSTGSPRLNVEEPAVFVNNLPRYYISNKVPLYNKKGEVIGILGITTDITDLKEAKEKAESANQAKTEFIANMRHDIRTSLSGIVGFSEILREQLIEPRFKEYADNLVASGHALHELMDEILESIIVSTGNIPLLKKKFSLADTLTSITELYASKAAEKQLDLTLSIDEALPKYIIGDKIRFHRIVLELVGNALNFTATGHVAVRVELAKQEQQSLVLRLTVSDTGMGIAKDKQQDIYVQFKRLTPSYQGIYKGAGLGLSIVKQFIDELGGEIYVESETGKGAVFTCVIHMHLPLLDDATGVEPIGELATIIPYLAPVKNQVLPIELASASKATSRVLVVEDNFLAQTVVKGMLTSMACQVDVASCGNDALARCKEHDYDLIFMDIGLGEGMDGYEVTQCIRRSNFDTIPHIPIIALTAHGGDENRQRCIEAGMDAVLTKPLTRAHAIDILKNFIPARREAPSAELTPMRRDLPDKDEEMFQLSQFALLSPEDALVNCGTQALLIDLLKLMLEEVPDDLASMKTAYAAKDYPMVETLAHKIKGGAVYVGTNRMKYACQYVERYWKTGERKLMDALYQQAVGTIEETITHIKSWLQQAR